MDNIGTSQQQMSRGNIWFSMGLVVVITAVVEAVLLFGILDMYTGRQLLVACVFAAMLAGALLFSIAELNRLAKRR